MGEVVESGITTTLDIPPERVLSSAIAANLESVIVVGMDHDGVLYLASSTGYSPDLLWLVKMAEQQIMAEEPTPCTRMT